MSSEQRPTEITFREWLRVLTRAIVQRLDAEDRLEFIPEDSILGDFVFGRPDDALRRSVEETGNIEEGLDEDIQRFFGGFFDSIEDDVIKAALDTEEVPTTELERRLNEAEGAALEDAITAIAGLYTLEAAGVGQLESGQFLVAQMMAFLSLENVLGRRLGMVYEKGVDPALEAEVAKQTREEFVNLQDAVEFALRTKEQDVGYLRRFGASDEALQLVDADDPVSKQNILEEWGIRDDNLPILEQVALESMEFEELIETPAELGLIVDDEVLDLVLDLAGYPEPLKDFLREVPEAIPRSNRLWEEKTAVEPTVEELETLVANGEISPTSGVAMLPGEVDEAKPALEDRFRNLQELPNKAPTRSQTDGSFAWGLIDRQELEDRYDRVDVDPEKYEDVITAGILDEADGQLQEAFALGLLSEQEYSTLLEQAGLDDEAIGQLETGASISDITKQRLQEQADPAELGVASVSGIGESRAAGLRAAGIETVGDLAGADVDTVAEAAQVETETAQGFIDQATLRVS